MVESFIESTSSTSFTAETDVLPVVRLNPMKCSVCATVDFRPAGKVFDMAFRCDACDIVFCVACAGRETVDVNIDAFRCPNDNSHSIRDIDPSDALADYSGMTVNERLFAAGKLDAYDDAAQQRDLDAMIAILVTVQMTPQQARETSETVLANPAKYGY